MAACQLVSMATWSRRQLKLTSAESEPSFMTATMQSLVELLREPPSMTAAMPAENEPPSMIATMQGPVELGQEPASMTATVQAESGPPSMTAKMQGLIELSLQRFDGSSAKILVEPGATVADILDREASKLSADCVARLVTETAVALAPHSQIWEAQALLFGVTHIRPSSGIRSKFLILGMSTYEVP